MTRFGILLVLLALCFGMSDSKIVTPFTKCHVKFRNSLQHHKNLMVHCRSKDDDLGYHLLGPLGVYEFGFKNNAWRSTLFWCHLWQGPHFKHHQVFVAYATETLECGSCTCRWDAREEGIYVYVGRKPFFMYAWDVPHKSIAPLSSDQKFSLS